MVLKQRCPPSGGEGRKHLLPGAELVGFVTRSRFGLSLIEVDLSPNTGVLLSGDRAGWLTRVGL